MKNVKKEFGEKSIDAETEIKVLSDVEIENNIYYYIKKQKDIISKKHKTDRIPSKEKFEIMVKMLIERSNFNKEQIDELSIKYYNEPYYK